MESTADGDTQAKTNMMVDIPHTAIGRRNKKNKKNSGHNRNNSKGNDNQRGKGKKGKSPMKNWRTSPGSKNERIKMQGTPPFLLGTLPDFRFA